MGMTLFCHFETEIVPMKFKDKLLRMYDASKMPDYVFNNLLRSRDDLALRIFEDSTFVPRIGTNYKIILFYF